MIFYGNGKNLSRWINSIANVFKNYDIINDHFEFRKIISFENENRTYLAFALNNNEFNMKKLSEYEFKLNELYGMMLLSRYAKNEYSHYNVKDFHIDSQAKLDFKKILGHSSIETTMKYYSNKDNDDLIALKSGLYFMIFKKDDIPFFDELNKTNRVVCKDNKEYHLYDAPNWEVAKKIDALMGDDWLGYDIDEYSVDKNINV